VRKLQTAAMVGFPFLARRRSSGRETTLNTRRAIESIDRHLFNELAEKRAKETFGGTGSVPETLLAPYDVTRIQKKKMGKGLVLIVANSTSEVAAETTVHEKVDLVLKLKGNAVKEFVSKDSQLTYATAIKAAPYAQRHHFELTSDVAPETTVHEKVDLVLKLKGNAAKVFVSKVSQLTDTTAIKAAPYVQRQQFEIGSNIHLVVMTLAMVVCCIRAAKCCRKLMTRVSIGKQSDEKAIKDHVGTIAKGKALEYAQKKYLESSGRHFLSIEKELKVSVAVREECRETDRKKRALRATDDKGPVLEVSDLPELIFSISRSAIEATHNSLLEDCPSLESTTLSDSDSSISSDEEMTNHRGGSIISSGSPGRSVKRISFCTSPPQVREYERYDMERKQPSSKHNGTPIHFNNLNKKRRMLKKNLDKLNGDGEASDVPGQGTQAVTRIAKQLAQAILMVSASILTQRR
jgi:hypothetical protein